MWGRTMSISPRTPLTATGAGRWPESVEALVISHTGQLWNGVGDKPEKTRYRLSIAYAIG